MLQRDASGSRSTSYRKVLIDRISTTSDKNAADGLQSPPTTHHLRNAENSEARQREALEIADRILHLPNSEQQQLGELSAGGGSLTAQPVIVTSTVDPEQPTYESGSVPTDISDSSQIPSADDSSNPNAASPAASIAEQPSTVVVSQIFTDGYQRDLVVDAARISFLEVMSNGLESEDLEIPGPLQNMWWSNIVTKDGARAPPVSRPAVGHTAAIATSLTNGDDAPPAGEDEQCKIHVLDVGSNLGPSLGARPCDLSYKRVWPFSRHKFGIDGVETLLPEDYQYAAEHWISESIRNSSRYVGSIEEADFVFVDMWCYHTAWMAYIHPLGNRNATNPEPYMRRTLNAIVKMDKYEIALY